MFSISSVQKNRKQVFISKSILSTSISRATIFIKKATIFLGAELFRVVKPCRVTKGIHFSHVFWVFIKNLSGLYISPHADTYIYADIYVWNLICQRLSDELPEICAAWHLCTHQKFHHAKPQIWVAVSCWKIVRGCISHHRRRKTTLCWESRLCTSFSHSWCVYEPN